MEAAWLHPVLTVQRIPPELEAAVLDIFEELWAAVAGSIVVGDTDGQTCAELLLHVLPQMLLAQPRRRGSG
eukprot:12430033-Karenia_brevis.AAC.1